MGESQSNILISSHQSRLDEVSAEAKSEQDKDDAFTKKLKGVFVSAGVTKDMLNPDTAVWFKLSYGTMKRNSPKNREGILLLATDEEIYEPQKGGKIQDAYLIVKDSNGDKRAVKATAEQVFRGGRGHRATRNMRKGENLTGLKFTIPNSGEDELFAGQDSESLEFEYIIFPQVGDRVGMDQSMIYLEPRSTDSYVELDTLSPHNLQDPKLLADFIDK